MDKANSASSSLEFARGSADLERAVSRFFDDFQDRDGSALSYVVRRPLRTLSAACGLLRLPVLHAVTTPNTAEGAVVTHALRQRHTLRRFLPHMSVIVLPLQPGQYSVGPSRQTLRRMVRKARQAGITCCAVEDPGERRRLIETFDKWERTNPQSLYRDPEARNDDCLKYRLWLTARARDGRPLVLSVTPVDGEWALLRYFRTLGTGTEQSLARYAMIQFLVERLVQDGVRYLFDETSPARLPNGLRHYQRMVGFRVFRVRARTSRLVSRQQVSPGTPDLTLPG